MGSFRIFLPKHTLMVAKQLHNIPAKALPSVAGTRAFKLFIYFGTCSYAFASVAYFILHRLLPDGHVFGMLHRMFLYHASHPYQYIAVATFTYSFVASCCIIKWPQAKGRWKAVLIIGILISSVFLASVPGGVLWKIHDMQAGFFPEWSRFWSDLYWGASTGLKSGWLILALSIPYNILCLIAGYTITHFGFRIHAKTALGIASSPRQMTQTSNTNGPTW